MPQIPKIDITTKDWTDQTALPRTLRSGMLKAVDKALSEYNKNNQADAYFPALRDAFGRWERSRDGQDKLPTARDNRTGIVTDLRSQIEVIDTARLAQLAAQPGVKTALDALRKNKDAALREIFSGKELQWKDQLRSAITDGLSVASDLKKAGKNFDKALTDEQRDAALVDICGGVQPEKLFDSLGLRGIDAFKESAEALFGSVTEPLVLAKNLATAAKQLWTTRAVDKGLFALAPGNAEQALAAVKDLLSHELQITGANIAVSAAKIVADASTGGAAAPLTSAAKAMVNVLMTVSRAAHDYTQFEKGKALLEAGSVDLGAFAECPILGCHYLAIGGDSVLLQWHESDLGSGSSFDKTVLDLKAEAAPAIDLARKYIAASRFQLIDPAKPNADWAAGGTRTINSLWDRFKSSVAELRKTTVKTSNTSLDDVFARLLPIGGGSDGPSDADLVETTPPPKIEVDVVTTPGPKGPDDTVDDDLMDHVE